MTCQLCGREADTEAKFCVDCGSPLVLRCPACQTPFEFGSRYCSLCGRSLPGSVTSDPQEPAEQTVIQEKLSEPQLAQPSSQVEQPHLVTPQSFSCPRCHQKNDIESEYCFACGLPLEDMGKDSASLDSTEANELHSPAGFWIRVSAYLVDVLAVGAFVIVIATFYAIYFVITHGDFPTNFEESPVFDYLFFLAVIINHIVLVAIWATTVGKRLFGLYIVRSDGSRVGLGRALVRHLASYLSGLLLFLGFLQVAFREDKLSLHDKISGTKVVKRNRRPRSR